MWPSQQSCEVSEGITMSTVQMSVPRSIYVKKVFTFKLGFWSCLCFSFVYVTEFIDSWLYTGHNVMSPWEAPCLLGVRPAAVESWLSHRLRVQWQGVGKCPGWMFSSRSKGSALRGTQKGNYDLSLKHWGYLRFSHMSKEGKGFPKYPWTRTLGSL